MINTLSTELLLAAPPAPDADLIQAEIIKIDGLLYTRLTPLEWAKLNAVYQALSWARSPGSFAPPSEMLK